MDYVGVQVLGFADDSDEDDGVVTPVRGGSGEHPSTLVPVHTPGSVLEEPDVDRPSHVEVRASSEAVSASRPSWQGRMDTLSEFTPSPVVTPGRSKDRLLAQNQAWSAYWNVGVGASEGSNSSGMPVSEDSSSDPKWRSRRSTVAEVLHVPGSTLADQDNNEVIGALLQSDSVYRFAKAELVPFSLRYFLEYFVVSMLQFLTAPVMVWKEGWKGFMRGRVITTWWPGLTWLCIVLAWTARYYVQGPAVDAVMRPMLTTLFAVFLITSFEISLQYAQLDEKQRANFLGFYMTSALAHKHSHVDDPIDVAERQQGVKLLDSPVLVLTPDLLDLYARTSNLTPTRPSAMSTRDQLGSEEMMQSLMAMVCGGDQRARRFQIAVRRATEAYLQSAESCPLVRGQRKYTWTICARATAAEIVRRSVPQASFSKRQLRATNLLALYGSVTPFLLTVLSVQDDLQVSSIAVATLCCLGLFPMLAAEIRMLARLFLRARSKQRIIHCLDAMLDLETATRAGLPFLDVRLVGNALAWGNLYRVLTRFQLDNHVNSEAVGNKLLALCFVGVPALDIWIAYQVLSGAVVDVFTWHTCCMLAILGSIAVLAVIGVEAKTNSMIDCIRPKLAQTVSMILADLIHIPLSERATRRQLSAAASLIHAKNEELQHLSARGKVLGVTITFTLARAVGGAMLSIIITVLSYWSRAQ